MTRIVFDTDNDQTVAHFVSMGIHGREQHSFYPYDAMGVVVDGILEAGIVYFEYCDNYGICEMAAYSRSRKWMTKGVLLAAFSFPFVHKGLRAVVARHSEYNKEARRLWTRMGATETVLPQLRGDDENEIVAFLHRRVWEKSRFGPNMGRQTPDRDDRMAA